MRNDQSKHFPEELHSQITKHVDKAKSWAKKVHNLPTKHSRSPEDLENNELQTDLLTQCLNADAKTVLFTGATKDTETAELAATFADTLSNDARIKTLLIDCNFRNPSQHDRFTFDGSDTLLSIMKDDTGIDGIGPTERNNLYVLPAGGKDLNDPTALFRSDNFEHLLMNARDTFNLVILDGPPVTLCAESRYLSGKVDGVILVLEAESTRKHIAIEAKKYIEKTGGKLLGVILNNVKYRIPEWLYRRI
jgi:capsular exopolysaccharide synthesis family protein